VCVFIACLTTIDLFLFLFFNLFYFLNYFIKYSPPCQIRLLHLFSLCTMDFKEAEIGVSETVTIFSHKLAEVLNTFSCDFFCHTSMLSYKNKHL